MKPKDQDLRIAAMIAIFSNIIFSLLLIYSRDMDISGKLIGVVLGMWYLGMLIYYLYQRSIISALFMGLSVVLIPITRIINDLIITYWF